MAEKQSHLPKRKRRVRAAREPPFPVPIASVTKEIPSKDKWFYYTGEFCGNHVLVKHSGDIHFLYKMGFYGKGTLSRSCPDHNERCPNVTVPNNTGDTVYIRVQNRRTFVRHTNWKRLAENRSSDTEELLELQTSSEDEDDHDENVEYTCVTVDSRDGNQATQSDVEMEQDVADSDDGHIISGQKEFSETDEVVTSWEDGDGDANFWGSEPPQTECDEHVDKSGACWDTEDPDFWASEDQADRSVKQQTVSDIERGVQGESEHEKLEKSAQHAVTDIDLSHSEVVDKQVMFEEKEKLIKGKMESSSSSADHSAARTIAHPPEDGSVAKTCDVENPVTSENGKQTQCLIQEVTENRKQTQCVVQEVTENGKQTQCVVQKVTENGKQIQCVVQEVTENEKYDITPDVCKPKQIDPLCEEEDSDGDIFVIKDSDSETESKKKKARLKWQPVVKIDPYFVQEHLQLSLEESFFLAYGLGCLVVLDTQKKPMNLSEMWRQFCDVQNSFIPNYVVYHYFRSKGWVPKSGLKFGVDFILYKEGPPFFHGSYSVVVKVVDEDSLSEDSTFSQRRLSWTSLAGLNRITGQVSKELMFCYVIRSRSITSEDLLSPKCIPKFRVQEMVLSRWVSSQERENKAEEEIL